MTVLPFPSSREMPGGTIHVYPIARGYEIGHESRSGSSWGNFRQFDCPEAAVAAGYALNRDEMNGDCDVAVSSQVVADLPRSPPPIQGEF